MPKVIRWLAAIVVVTGLAFAIHATAWTPYRQGIRKRQIQEKLRGIAERSGGSLPNSVDTVVLLENVRWLNNALRFSPTDPVLHMQLAHSYVLLGRRDEAIAQWRVALRHHRRPEIYLALGETLLMSGDLEGAITSYAHAAAFNPGTMPDMPEAIRDRIAAKARELYGPAVVVPMPPATTT